jgi:hypothetical protein
VGTSNKAFRLFFVPIIPYGKKHYLMCPTCNKGRQLDAAGVALVPRAMEVTGRFRTGQPTHEQYTAELDSLRNPPAALPSAG